MIDDKYKLAGLFVPTGEFPSFSLPVFLCAFRNPYYIQNVNESGNISHFEELDPEGLMIIPIFTDEENYKKIDDEAIWAISIDHENHIYGTKENLLNMAARPLKRGKFDNDIFLLWNFLNS
ncbi:hypothetical protein [Caenispirillum bisanense]|uniref:hypothetical protein n=1 Tax=Caenispirillum bisanense TaxID=414052 RepID=UPI0011436B45|nr:hypothetical protein [Caenispirillum bisanense]